MNKLDAHKTSSPEEIAQDIKYMRVLAQTSEDDRVRFNATKYLIEHDWEVFEHENPVVQKSEVIHKVEKIQVELIG